MTQAGDIAAPGTIRLAVRRAGVVLGVLAMALQCLTVAFHRPAQAAPAFPFQDPAAWCLSGDSSGAPTLPGDGGQKAPLYGVVVCPLCQTAHATGAGLVPTPILILGSAAASVVVQRTAIASGAPGFGEFAARPRGPPTFL